MKKLKGFSTLQFVILIAIFGIVVYTAFNIFSPLNPLWKKNDIQRKNDLAQIQKLLDLYYRDFRQYPDYDPNTYQIKDTQGIIKSWGTTWSPYGDLPQDPFLNKYVYIASSDNQSYWIYASMQVPNETGACNGGGACTGNSIIVSNPKLCGGICNFGVSSENASP